jgi:hypothetical protein
MRNSSLVNSFATTTAAMLPMCCPHVQAFGAGNLHMMSVMLVRAQLVCMVSVLPTLLLWSSGALARWLPLLGQQADIAEPASRWADCSHWTVAHGLLPISQCTPARTVHAL